MGNHAQNRKFLEGMPFAISSSLVITFVQSSVCVLKTIQVL